MITRNLDIEIPIEQIKAIYEQHGVIQLRSIDKSINTLILGCGNGRLCNAGQSPLDFDGHPIRQRKS